MKILTAKFHDGRLDLPEGMLREGDSVTLLVPTPGAAFNLTDEERKHLAEAIAEIEQGAGIDGWRMLDEREC